jgi:hypothetical protein
MRLYNLLRQRLEQTPTILFRPRKSKYEDAVSASFAFNENAIFQTKRDFKPNGISKSRD